MKGLFAIVRKEIAERWLLFVAALLAGLVPLMIVSVSGPRITAADSMPLKDLLGTTLLCFAALCTLLVGPSLLGPDLSERRLGFYFARPLPGCALFCGKLVAGWLLLLGSTLLAILPTLLTGSPALQRYVERPAQVLTVLLCLTFLLVPMGMAAGMMMRSRSRWLIADMLLAPLVGLGVYLAQRSLERTGGWLGGDRLGPQLLLLCLPLGLALSVASAAAALTGRTDPKRVRRVLSCSVWPLCLLALLPWRAYTRWTHRASLHDLVSARVQVLRTAPRGSWIAIRESSNRPHAYPAVFLWDLWSGHSVQLGQESPSDPRRITFSGDGRRAAWVEERELPLGDPFALFTMDLDDPRPRPVRVAVSLPREPEDLFLSPDGTRVGWLDRQWLRVYDLPAQRALVSIDLGQRRLSGRSQVGFVSPDRLRLMRLLKGVPDPGGKDHPLRLFELDLKTGKFEQTGSLPDIQFLQSPDRIVVWYGAVTWRAGKYVPVMANSLHDGRSGARIADLPRQFPIRSPLFLADGRLLAGETGPAARLHLILPSGVEERSIELGPADQIYIGGQTTPDVVLVSVVPRLHDRWHYTGITAQDMTVLRVDLKTGSVRPVAHGLAPIPAHWPGGDQAVQPVPGSLATRLFTGIRGSLVLLDPESGQRRVLVPGVAR